MLTLLESANDLRTPKRQKKKTNSILLRDLLKTQHIQYFTQHKSLVWQGVKYLDRGFKNDITQNGNSKINWLLLKNIMIKAHHPEMRAETASKQNQSMI